MGRSQRHKIEEQGFSSAGAFYEQGAINDAICGAIDGDIPGAIPKITSLDPAFVLVGGASVTLRVLGEQFGPNCVIYINGWDEETTYVDVGEVTTGFTTSLFAVPATLPIYVKKASTLDSNVVYFEVRAAGQEVMEGGEQLASNGPFNLLRVEPDDEEGGVWYVLSRADGEQIKAGDTVMVEATGASTTNGEFIVQDIDTDTEGETAIYREGPTIMAAIAAKGRMTVS